MKKETDVRKHKLRLATVQFPVSADIERNCERIAHHMKAAARRKANIVHFSEACLSGYPGDDFDSFEGYDWPLLEEKTREIKSLARELKLWCILGTAHKAGRRSKPTNALYLISPRGAIAKRYDKCFCMESELEHYRPGKRFVTHTLNGIKFGLLICFDFRFPEAYRAHLKRGVKLVFNSFYMTGGGAQRVGVMRSVGPAHLSSRAAENTMFVVANNTSKTPQCFPAMVIRPDGWIEKKLPLNREGVLVYNIDIAKTPELYNPIGKLALRVSRGTLHS